MYLHKGNKCVHEVIFMSYKLVPVLKRVFTASMGVTEGKAVGQWFGPNTIAQVLR